MRGIALIDRLRERLQIDRTLGYVLTLQAWRSVSGFVTLGLVIAYLTKQNQGVYHTLYAIVGVQALFDLGLSNVLISQAGHNKINADDGLPQSDDDAIVRIGRMAELIGASQRWFVRISIVFLLIAGCLGVLTFVEVDSGLWLLPLLGVLPLAAMMIAYSPAISILEGAGYREDIYRCRLYQWITGSLCVWASLVLGGGLWTISVAFGVQVLWMAYIRHVRYAGFFGRFVGVKGSRGDAYSWSSNVVPIQWRAAVISIVCHVATQFFLVIVTRFDSELAAAPLGTTLQITAAIQAISLAWVQANYSVISADLGNKDREAAGTRWRSVAVISTGLLLAASAALMILLWLMPQLETWLGHSLVDRFLMPWQAVVLLTGILFSHIVSLQGYYVMANGDRPLVVATVVGFGSVAIAVWTLGILYGLNGVLIGYAATMVLVAFPVHTAAYLRWRRD